MTNWVKKGLKRGFNINGCTKVPNFHVKSCCDRHDYHYADLKLTKWRADKLLFKCMWRRGIKGKLLAPIYFVGVSIFGHFYFKRKQNEAIARVGTPDDPYYDGS